MITANYYELSRMKGQCGSAWSTGERPAKPAFSGSSPHYLQMANDAEGFGSQEPASGAGRELMGPADQQVPCGRIAAALGAHIAELRYLGQGYCPES